MFPRLDVNFKTDFLLVVRFWRCGVCREVGEVGEGEEYYIGID